MDMFLVRMICPIQVKIELELHPYSFIIKKKREKNTKQKKKRTKKKIFTRLGKLYFFGYFFVLK
jgi:hypothetical protein